MVLPDEQVNRPDLISDVGNQDGDRWNTKTSVTELEGHRENERLSAQWETVHEGEVPFGLAMTIRVSLSISGNYNILGEFS
jgi:hypothetical protein